MDKQYYYMSVTELIIPPEAPFEEVHEAINRFIDALPFLAEELSENIRLMEYKTLAEILETALPLITDIHAKLLETDMKLIIRRIERTGYPTELIASFIANLMTLSIKLQRAQYYGDEIVHIKNVEDFTDIAHTLTSFITLLDEGDYTEAHNIISAMNVFDDETLFVFDKLLSSIVTKEYDVARITASDFKKKHVKILQQHAGSNHSVKVLAVDDMPESLSFISNVLKNHFKIFRITNGKTALKFLRSQKVNLIILDIDMPDMKGYDVAKEIRKISEYAEVPIIFLSGNSTREYVMKAKEAGGCDYIIKPTNYETLMTSVLKHIKV
ncbi:MAG: response regulator [Oscillospiraceae bacterium]|nr:response regulator [Oscillospiraceae bacterium]